MSNQKPGFVQTDHDELTYRLNGLAMQVHNELKLGHRERHYQERLAQLCRAAGLQVETEKRLEVWVEDALVGYMFLDLWVEDRMVVECKALSHLLTNDELYQVVAYLVATGTTVGMIYNFGRSRLDYHRIFPPSQVQNWQQSLYRVTWVRPGMSLPPLDSTESGDPIRFVVHGTDRAVEIPLQSSAAPIRSSGTSSAAPIRSSVQPSTTPIRSSAESSVDAIRSSVQSSAAPIRSSGSSSVDPIRSSVRSSVEKSVAKSVDYRAAGVDIDAGNRAVELMKDAVRSTYTPAVLAGVGSFGGLFDAGLLKDMRSPVLVASTDGVGTKVKLAAQAGRFGGIGHDIVNHCINDILVQGARPLFFMDYFAASHLVPEVVAEIVTGMAEACRAAGMSLLGGETAEMPGVYQAGEFDVAGTIVGVVEREAMLPCSNLRAGDVLIGLRSSGPHTNGYSLLRSVFEDTPLDTNLPELGGSLADALLSPHRSYLGVLSPVLDRVKALVHITGGGFVENVPRVLPEGLGARILNASWPVPPLFELIRSRGGIAGEEMYRVFNMGIGMIAIVDRSEVSAIRELVPEETFIIGELITGERRTVLADAP